MSTVDLDDIRERVESHYVGVPSWSAGQDARVLLGEVERLRGELDGMRNLDPSVLIQQLGLVAVHTQDGGRYYPEDVWFEVDRPAGEDGTDAP